MSELFRKKSIERVTSPEQLNDYIRVSNPGVWMVLAAVVILLAGVCVWGFFGRLDTKKQASGVCENGKLTCYIKSDDIADVKEDTIISVDGKEYTVKSVSSSPVRLDGEISRRIFRDRLGLFRYCRRSRSCGRRIFR